MPIARPGRMRRPPRVLAAAVLGALAVSCALPRPDAGFADRCADLMKEAFPGADIAIAKKRAFDDTSADFHTIVAEVEGERRDVGANDRVTRNLAVECRFSNGILTAFRWTVGPTDTSGSPRP
jgi:hypothetical protein